MRKILIAISLMTTIACDDSYDVFVESEKQSKEVVSLSMIYDFASSVSPSELLGGEFDGNKKLCLKEFDVETICDTDGDTIYFAINYADDAGYILVDASLNAEVPILAFNDTGKFISTHIDELPIGAESNENKESFWVEGNIPMLSKVENVSFNKSSRGDKKLEKEVMPNVGKKYKWGQGNGYNNDAPNHASIGCPAVAIGMLCMHNRYPACFDYSKMPTKIEGDDGTKSNPLSKMLKQIANNIPNYQWGNVKDALSYANDDNIVEGLRKIGYKDAQWGEYCLTDVIEELYEGHAVLLAGEDRYGTKGHIWFCDGVTQFVTKKSKNTNPEIITVSSLYKRRTYFYFNVGKDGEDNGWYYTRNWGKLDHERVMFTHLSK